jgi:hypothetical protein
MIATGGKKTSQYCQLQDPDLDCPNPFCDGWLNLFGTILEKKPTYFLCSNKYNPDPKKKCFKKTIFSKLKSICSVCRLVIEENDIITTNPQNKWVHVPCSLIKSESGFFSVCLRCSKKT